MSSSTPKISAALRARAKKIRILLMDADGTLTDGRVWLISEPNDQSAVEMKVFDAHDGAGLTLATTAGIRTGIITGRESPAMRRRAKEMKIEFLYERAAEKIPVYEEILRLTGATDAEVAYVGDDLPDIAVMQRVGLAVAVGDATPETKRASPLRHQSPRRPRRDPRIDRTNHEIQRHLGKNVRKGTRIDESRRRRK